MSAAGAADTSPFLIGFSGGGDSRALLQHALDTVKDREIVACVVDHGLREGSKEDGERAAAMAREAGARAEIKTLTWPNDPQVSQAAARTGRMFALATLARAVGASDIYLAHTMDDQAETLAMRASRASRWRGLSGMMPSAPVPLWPSGRNLRLRRPMLDTRRDALRDALRARDISWIEDPSNDAERFARVRVRKLMNEWEAHGAGVARWASIAARIAPISAAIDRAARALLKHALSFTDSSMTLNPGTYMSAPPDVRAPALAALIAAASGARGGADWEQLVRLDSAILDGEAKGGTLGGARFFASGNALVFTRDPGAVLGREGVAALASVPLQMGQQVVWDGRVALTAREIGWQAAPGIEGAAPLLLRPRTAGRLTLREGMSQGVVHAEWLLEERIAHLLWR